MILGTGNDIVEVARINALLESKGEAFISRVFTPHEQTYCTSKANRANAYAKRFAAKEACAKALGCGIGGEAFFTDIEVINNERGAPLLVLKDKALTTLQSMLPKGHKPKIFLALADENAYAIAHVIIEAEPA